MKLLLDTANIFEIELLTKTTAIAGVTTNPSLMAKEKKGDYIAKLRDICQVVQQSAAYLPHLSVEAISVEPEEIYRQGLELAEKLDTPGVSLHVKVPVTVPNLAIISRLVKSKVQVNATACMTALQAKMASDAGARIVSFFYNRIHDGGQDPLVALDDFQHLEHRATQVICGSIRKAEDVFHAWTHGAYYVTASAKVIGEMMQHAQTDKAIKQFQEDIDRWRS